MDKIIQPPRDEVQEVLDVYRKVRNWNEYHMVLFRFVRKLFPAHTEDTHFPITFRVGDDEKYFLGARQATAEWFAKQAKA